MDLLSSLPSPVLSSPPHPAPALLLLPDSHISDVLQENEALKHRLELLELQAEQEKEMLKVEVAQAREQLLRYGGGWGEERERES